MAHLEARIVSKLDAQLVTLLEEGQLHPTGTIPIVLRCDSASLDPLSGVIAAVGGRVRHQLRKLEAIAAWVPFGAITALASNDLVHAMELDQEFAVA